MYVTVWTSAGAIKVALPTDATIDDLKAALAQYLHYDPDRLEISYGGRYVRDDVPVARFPPDTLVAEGPRIDPQRKQRELLQRHRAQQQKEALLERQRQQAQAQAAARARAQALAEREREEREAEELERLAHQQRLRQQQQQRHADPRDLLSALFGAPSPSKQQLQRQYDHEDDGEEDDDQTNDGVEGLTNEDEDDSAANYGSNVLGPFGSFFGAPRPRSRAQQVQEQRQQEQQRRLELQRRQQQELKQRQAAQRAAEAKHNNVTTTNLAGGLLSKSQQQQERRAERDMTLKAHQAREEALAKEKAQKEEERRAHEASLRQLEASREALRQQQERIRKQQEALAAEERLLLKRMEEESRRVAAAEEAAQKAEEEHKKAAAAVASSSPGDEGDDAVDEEGTEDDAIADDNDNINSTTSAAPFSREESAIIIPPHLQRVGLDETLHRPQEEQPSPATSASTTPRQRPTDVPTQEDVVSPIHESSNDVGETTRDSEERAIADDGVGEASNTQNTEVTPTSNLVTIKASFAALDGKVVDVTVSSDALVADVLAQLRLLEPEATKQGVRIMFFEKYVRNEKDSIRAVPLADGSAIDVCTGKFLSENEMTLYLASRRLASVRADIAAHPERPLPANLKGHWNESLMKALMLLDSLQEVPDDVRQRRKASVKEVIAEQDRIAEM